MERNDAIWTCASIKKVEKSLGFGSLPKLQQQIIQSVGLFQEICAVGSIPP